METETTPVADRESALKNRPDIDVMTAALETLKAYVESFDPAYLVQPDFIPQNRDLLSKLESGLFRMTWSEREYPTAGEGQGAEGEEHQRVGRLDT